MKASGYYCAIVDFENFISEMTTSFSNLKSLLQIESSNHKKISLSKWLTSTDVTKEQRLILAERNLLVLSSCWNLCLYHQATQATVINIPEEAAEMYFTWFKGRVDQHLTKH